MHQYPLGDFLKPGWPRIAGPQCCVSDSVGLEWEVRIYISIKLLGDADVLERYSYFESH